MCDHICDNVKQGKEETGFVKFEAYYASTALFQRVD